MTFGRLLRLAAPAVLAISHISAAQAANRPLAIRELRVTPATLTLQDSRDVRRLLVSGKTADGYWLDITDKCKFGPSALVKRDSDGLFTPLKVGKTTLTISAAGKNISVPVTVKSVKNAPISFVREVMPILSRTGCTAGLCHGSAKGKNGFKLSLRGYDPDYDYHALVDDLSGRRFNRAQPKESLLLQKVTQDVAHQGGLVFEENSRFYPVLYRWIAEGVKSDVGKATRANRLEILPNAPMMHLPGEAQQLIVLAHYADGSVRDVTRDAIFSTTMKDVATVTEDGKVDALKRGETAILVRYEGNYAANEITVIGDRTGYAWKPQPQLNYIDKLVDAKLNRIQSVPSGLCTDAEFVRRIYLDVAGVIPTSESVRTFLADKMPNKRAALIDKLLDSADFVEYMANKWSDLLQVNRKYLGDKGVWKFRNWIRDQVARNRPYDEFVREILTASGDAFEHPAANYFRVARDPNQATENVTQLFLGIRFNCNKCHDHPFERWTLGQYYQFAANFARVGYKPGSLPGDETILNQPAGEVMNPRTNMVAPASFPFPVSGTMTKAPDRRQSLAAWMTSPNNQYFARSYANRIWSYFLGRGIIDPVDDIRQGNPPVNKPLLDALTDDFIKSGFNVKHLIRTICNSRVYQSSLSPNRWNSDDTINFSHAVPRRLTAEQLVDSISRATGSMQRYPGVPAGFRAIQLPDTSVAAGGFLDLFGRPPRESPCECERSSNVSLGQALALINSPMTNETVADPNGRVGQLMKSDPAPEMVIDELYVAAWGRHPTARELKRALPLFDVSNSRLQELATSGKITAEEARRKLRTEAAQDLLWGLINSPAFLFNR